MLDLPGRGEALMDELHDLVMEEALLGVSPRPGAIELLDALAGAGMPVAVASNSTRPFVERVLGGAGLLDGRFRTVVTADDVASPKPAPTSTWRPARRWTPPPSARRRWRTPRRGWPRPPRRACS